MRMGSGAVKTLALEQLKLQLQEVHYDVTLRHLHTATLQKVSRSLRDSYSTLLDDPSGAQSALLGKLTEQGKVLLKHDPEFVIDRIGIVTAQGEAAFRGVLKLPGVTDEDLKGDPMAMVSRLEADITFEAPQALFENIPNGTTVMGMGIDQGYIKRESGKITSHIQFRKGALTINGKSPSVPPLLGGPPPAGG
jgi:uncharacterized protein YdgA (DUF945 family)